MSEVQGSEATDSDEVRTAPAKSGPPAWVGKASGAYIESERVGLIGWCFSYHCWTHKNTQLFASREFRLSALACHTLMIEGNGGYPALFEGCVLRDGLVWKTSRPEALNVIWADFMYFKSREPVLRNLVISSVTPTPAALNTFLRQARQRMKGE